MATSWQGVVGNPRELAHPPAEGSFCPRVVLVAVCTVVSAEVLDELRASATSLEDAGHTRTEALQQMLREHHNSQMTLEGLTMYSTLSLRVGNYLGAFHDWQQELGQGHCSRVY